MAKLLAEFFRIDDGNFERRYRFFYDELAPSLQLYRVRVGDTLTIKSFTKGGYVQSVKLQGVRHLHLRGARGFAHGGTHST